MTARPISPMELARLMICRPFLVMLALMVIEAGLNATTTYLVIQTGRDVAEGRFIIADLMWILAAQSTSYIVGAISWIFAERAGFLAYGRYMLRFARDNRHKSKLLGDKAARERVEPFLTGETFEVYFHLIYEIEGDLRILLALVLNVIVLGTQIDGSLPISPVGACLRSYFFKSRPTPLLTKSSVYDFLMSMPSGMTLALTILS